MKKFILIITAITALSTPAFAKLGESIAEVESRYGRAHGYGTDEYDHLSWRRYTYQDYEVTVKFIDGKSVCEKLTHKSESQKFSDVECLGLGKAIAGETEWNFFDHKGPATAWTSGDNMLLRSEISTATFSPFLEITGKSYRDHMEEVRISQSARQIDALADKFNGNVNTAKK